MTRTLPHLSYSESKIYAKAPMQFPYYSKDFGNHFSFFFLEECELITLKWKTLTYKVPNWKQVSFDSDFCNLWYFIHSALFQDRRYKHFHLRQHPQPSQSFKVYLHQDFSLWGNWLPVRQLGKQANVCSLEQTLGEQAYKCVICLELTGKKLWYRST